MKEHFERAIQYVREHKSWSEAEDAAALERINNLRCDINFASPTITNQIALLMDEYGENNDLPDGWWTEFGYEDEIFMNL